MEEVRRQDGELCGYVDARAEGWHALAVFGASLGVHGDRDAAVDDVVHGGLAALADRWTLRRPGADDEIVCIVEARPGEVTIALGPYAMPGVPRLTITAADLAHGDADLVR